MKLLQRSLSLVILLVVLIAIGLARRSIGQSGSAQGQLVVLEQRMFNPPSGNTQPLTERLNVQSLEGEPVTFAQLPTKAKEALTNLTMRVIPLLELNEANPRDAVRIIVRKPKPKHMIRLGLISDGQEKEADPSWLADLSFGEKTLSCVATNVSFLDLSIVLADAFEWEFGVTADGQATFRNKTSATGHTARQPLYAVKFKSPKSQ